MGNTTSKKVLSKCIDIITKNLHSEQAEQANEETQKYYISMIVKQKINLKYSI